jgi:membrane protein
MSFNIKHFLKEELWLVQEQALPYFHSLFIKSLKIALLSVQDFYRDLCPLRASALTLYSLLSIVPVIALLFGIAKGFGFEKILEQRLLEQVPNQETMVLQLLSFAQNMLDSTKGGVVAGIGTVVLFWTVINVISNIEVSFNHIWKINQGRSFSRKFSDYLSLMLLAPIVLVLSGSISLFLKTKLTWLTTVIQLSDSSSWVLIKALGLLPLMLMIGLFAFTFIFMPNHKINIKAGMIAGIVTGILSYLLQWAYLSLQLGASSYNAIYGSFAALPLFVVWLQAGWMVVLFGCEIAFFIQNYEIYKNKHRYEDLSFALQKVLALQITQLIIKNFLVMNKPLSATEIAEKLLIPIAIVQYLLAKLITSHIVVEFKMDEQGGDKLYQPAVDINQLTIAYVITALEQSGQHHLTDIKQEQLFMTAVDEFRQLMENSKHNSLLKEL